MARVEEKGGTPRLSGASKMREGGGRGKAEVEGTSREVRRGVERAELGGSQLDPLVSFKDARRPFPLAHRRIASTSLPPPTTSRETSELPRLRRTSVLTAQSSSESPSPLELPATDSSWA